ncbi:MAG: hypothetical protein IJR47_02550 [Clostridia bacterium]|nr:hypothetical protein [Clostridia bacterium]
MNFKKLLTYFCGAMLICVSLTGCYSDRITEETYAPVTAATEETIAPAYQRGSINGKEYINNSLKIKYTIKEGFSFMTAEQLNERFNSGADNSSKFVAAQKMEIYEMAAYASSGENVILMVQTLGGSVNEQEYCNKLKEQLSGTNLNPVYEGYKTRNVAGVDFTDLTYSYNQNGTEITQTMLIKSIEQEIVVINCTYTTSGGLEKVLSGFSAL